MNVETVYKLKCILMEKGFLACCDDNNLERSLLTGETIALDAVQMYQFLMCVEDEFSVIFSLDEINTYGFHTLEEIANAIENKNNF